MSLMPCSECNKQVSNLAESCPNCGAPIRKEKKPIPQGQEDRVVVTELTSKRLKAHVAVSVIIMIVGLIMWFVYGPLVIAVPMMVAGFVWFIFTKIRIWWYHD